MNEAFLSQPSGEWSFLHELEQRFSTGGLVALSLSEEATVRRGAMLAGLSAAEVDAAVGGGQDALRELVMKSRKRIREGSIAFSRALGAAARLSEDGQVEAAARVLEEFASTDVAQFYKEMALHQAEALR